MLKKSLMYSCLLVLLTSFVMPACLLSAQTGNVPFLHPLFSDHAVLQRDIPIRVWGWAEPGSAIAVTLADQSKQGRADQDGRWEVVLRPMHAGGPYHMTVTGPQTVEVQDILMGDVWICSGQSNMEMGIAACNVPDEIAQANYPNIRLLTVPKAVEYLPIKTANISWKPCSSKTILEGVWGGFSAAGYFFGQELYKNLNIPIGLIHTSWGGTIVEAWTSEEGLAPYETIAPALKGFQASRDSLNMNPDELTRVLTKWFEANDPGSAQKWYNAQTDRSDWKTVNVPAEWEQIGINNFDGFVWFTREVDIPASWAGKALQLRLGPIDDADQTWFNDTPVGSDDRWNVSRSYTVPSASVKAGSNRITVRVWDTGGNGGFVGQTNDMTLTLQNDSQAKPISLAGQWQCKVTTPQSKLTSKPATLNKNNPNVTTVLYNGMIAPLVPYGIKGAIWYQGESNAGRAWQYRTLLPALIKNWRNDFKVGDFPFYIVQLAAFTQTAPEPRENDWAELREAQTWTAKNVPNCGLAVAIDIGEANDIHPKNKKDVGRRLAFAALAQTYGKDIPYSGPWYRSMSVEGSAIRLRFDHIDGGLSVHGDQLKGFAIAGGDRKFVWADARIDGDTVIVSSPQVAKPVAVRYAWDTNPVCNLFNKAGLPAVPFRTDDWTAITRNNR